MPEPSPSDRPGARLTRALEHAAHLLPAQGPISVFVHHNTLHAFEAMPFETAVERAAELLGCEPYLSEARYREELRFGRILDRDLVRVLRQDLGEDADKRLGSIATRFDVRLAMLRYGVRSPRGPELGWLIEDRQATSRLRPDLPFEMRRDLMLQVRGRMGRDLADRKVEQSVARSLWRACLGTVTQLPPVAPKGPRDVRPRDALLRATGYDTDAAVHPVLIRMCAAFLDQGIARWSLPDRDRGLFEAFLALYGMAAPVDARLRGLPRDLARERDAGDGEAASALRSLEDLGVPEAEWEPFITATLLALRGWAGMVRHLEVRPDRAPIHAPPATLLQFLAVRLLLERAALRFGAHEHAGYRGPLSGLFEHLRNGVRPPDPPTLEERAYPLFQLVQCLGVTPQQLARLDLDQSRALLEEIESFGEIERRRLLQLAYERRHEVETLDALSAHAREAPVPAPPPDFQAIFCIDEREESIRRHLEEVEPACETFGTPGFFEVAMYYRAAGEGRSAPLCPIAVRPEHEVAEEFVEAGGITGTIRGNIRRASALLDRSRLLRAVLPHRNPAFSPLMGVAAAVPLIIRVLFPRWAARLGRPGGFVPGPRTALAIHRRPDPPGFGTWSGFTVAEMADRVARVLEDTGISIGRSPLVLVVGHGSSSLNNPHESAHDCGACGGGRGGPNARAWARMANDPAVRETLAARGTVIPPDVWFAGAQHNTCNEAFEYYEADHVPPLQRVTFETARAALDKARRRNAHERARKFELTPTWLPPGLALGHVEDRTEDLAQPRPEYGHATNAACIVGRRERTRGLFLDRRAFLASYDPRRDDARGTILERVLNSVAPVGAGINLEYYFSFVDPVGYGCDTKLPHNVAGLVGVMDGHQSDLRTGLPWQMVEIHEPVRLLIVVDAEPAILDAVLDRQPALATLVRNRWVRLAVWPPHSDAISRVYPGKITPQEPESHDIPHVRSSEAWYRGRRAHLPCARIVPSRRHAG